MVEFFQGQEDTEVHAVRNKRPAYEVNENVHWHQADLRNPAEVECLIEKSRPTIIIQAAATTSGSKDIVSRPYIHVTDNAVMNSYIFKSAYDFSVGHVVFFSCTVMYPSSPVPIKAENYDANVRPHPKYFGVAHTKLYLEKMCEFYANISETKYTVIRHSNIYGSHDKYDLEKSHFFGATITKVMKAEKVVSVWGSGEEERDLLHVSDLCNFVSLALKNQTKSFRLFNCGLGQAHSVNEVVSKIIKASGKDLKVKNDLSQPSIKTSLSLNCERASEELGWKPKISLDDGIEMTLSWWQSNCQ